jgi:translation initiation factor IF-2
MLKIRVHELARELGKENKDILDYLTEKGYKGKTAVSSVPDDEADFLRSKFGAPKQQSKPAEKEAPKEMKSAPVKKAEEAGSPEKKKKTIIRVFRSQNASGQLQQHRPQKPMPAPAPKPAEPVRKAPEEPKAAPAAQAAPKIPEAPAVKPEAVKKPEAAEVRKPAEASAPAPVKAAPVTEEAKKPVQEHTAPASPYSTGNAYGTGKPYGAGCSYSTCCITCGILCTGS